MWSDLTIVWSNLTVVWSNLTWSKVTMERSDRDSTGHYSHVGGGYFPLIYQTNIFSPRISKLRVVSNFGDRDRGAGEIHTRVREISRRRDAKGAPKIRDYRLSQGV